MLSILTLLVLFLGFVPVLTNILNCQELGEDVMGDTACVYREGRSNTESVDDLLDYACNDTILYIYIQGGTYDLNGMGDLDFTCGGLGRTYVEKFYVLPFPGEEVHLTKTGGTVLVDDRYVDNVQFGSEIGDGHIYFHKMVVIGKIPETTALVDVSFYHCSFVGDSSGMGIYARLGQDVDNCGKVRIYDCEFDSSYNSFWANYYIDWYFGSNTFGRTMLRDDYGTFNSWNVRENSLKDSVFYFYGTDDTYFYFHHNDVEGHGDSPYSSVFDLVDTPLRNTFKVNHNNFSSAYKTFNTLFRSTDSDFEFSYNSFYNVSMPIFGWKTIDSRFVVTHNDFGGDCDRAVYFKDDFEAEGSEILITDNYFHCDGNPHWNGVRLKGTRSSKPYATTIADNVFREGAGNLQEDFRSSVAVYAWATSNQIDVSGNKIYGFEHGMLMENTHGNTWVRDNLFEGTVGIYGYYTYDNMYIEDNLFNDRERDIETYYAYWDGLYIRRNKFGAGAGGTDRMVELYGDSFVVEFSYNEIYDNPPSDVQLPDFRPQPIVLDADQELIVHSNVFHHGPHFDGSNPSINHRDGMLELVQSTGVPVRVFHNTFRCYSTDWAGHNLGFWSLPAIVYLHETSGKFDFINNAFIGCADHSADGERSTVASRNLMTGPQYTFSGNWGTDKLTLMKMERVAVPTFNVIKGPPLDFPSDVNHYQSVDPSEAFDLSSPPYFSPMGPLPGVPIDELPYQPANDFALNPKDLVCGDWCGNRTTAGALNGELCSISEPSDCVNGQNPDLFHLLCEDVNCPVLRTILECQELGEDVMGDTACVYREGRTNTESVDDLLDYACNDTILYIYIQGGTYDLNGMGDLDFSCGGLGRTYAEKFYVLPFPGEEVHLTKTGDTMLINDRFLDNVQFGSETGDGHIYFHKMVVIGQFFEIAPLFDVSFYHCSFVGDSGIELSSRSGQDQDNYGKVRIYDCEFDSSYSSSWFNYYIGWYMNSNVFGNSILRDEYSSFNSWNVQENMWTNTAFDFYGTVDSYFYFHHNDVQGHGEPYNCVFELGETPLRNTFKVNHNTFSSAYKTLNAIHRNKFSDFEFSYNYFYNVSMPIFAYESIDSRFVITHNDFAGDCDRGVYFKNDFEAEGSEILITDNYFHCDGNPHWNGVRLRRTRSSKPYAARIADNIFREGAGNLQQGFRSSVGVYALDTEHQIDVSGNKFYGFEHGMYMVGTSGNTWVRDNLFESYIGIYGWYTYDNMYIEDNLFNDRDRDIYTYYAYWDGLYIRGNKFGAGIEGTDRMVWLYGNSDLVEFSYNEIYDNPPSDVQLADFSDFPIFLEAYEELIVHSNVFHHGPHFDGSNPLINVREGMLHLSQTPGVPVRVFHNTFRCYSAEWAGHDNGLWCTPAIVYLADRLGTFSFFDFINNVFIGCGDHSADGERSTIATRSVMTTPQFTFKGNWGTDKLTHMTMELAADPFNVVKGAPTELPSDVNHYQRDGLPVDPSSVAFDMSDPPYFTPMSPLPGFPLDEFPFTAPAKDFAMQPKESVCGTWCGNRTTAGALNGELCFISEPSDCVNDGNPDIFHLLCEDFTCPEGIEEPDHSAPPSCQQFGESPNGDTACVYRHGRENWEAVYDLLDFASNETFRYIYIQGGTYDLDGEPIDFGLGGLGRSFAEKFYVLPFPNQTVHIYNNHAEDGMFAIFDLGLDHVQIGSEKGFGEIVFHSEVQLGAIGVQESLSDVSFHHCTFKRNVSVISRQGSPSIYGQFQFSNCNFHPEEWMEVRLSDSRYMEFLASDNYFNSVSVGDHLSLYTNMEFLNNELVNSQLLVAGSQELYLNVHDNQATGGATWQKGIFESKDHALNCRIRFASNEFNDAENCLFLYEMDNSDVQCLENDFTGCVTGIYSKNLDLSEVSISDNSFLNFVTGINVKDLQTHRSYWDINGNYFFSDDSHPFPQGLRVFQRKENVVQDYAVTLTNNVFHGTSGRGAYLAGMSDVMVGGNEFVGFYQGISFYYFYGDSMISNNVFDSKNAVDFYNVMGNSYIENNKFYDTMSVGGNGHCIYGYYSYLDKLVIRENKFGGYEGVDSMLFLDGSDKHVEISYNEFYDNPPNDWSHWGNGHAMRIIAEDELLFHSNVFHMGPRQDGQMSDEHTHRMGAIMALTYSHQSTKIDISHNTFKSYSTNWIPREVVAMEHYVPSTASLIYLVDHSGGLAEYSIVNNVFIDFDFSGSDYTTFASRPHAHPTDYEHSYTFKGNWANQRMTYRDADMQYVDGKWTMTLFPIQELEDVTNDWNVVGRNGDPIHSSLAFDLSTPPSFIPRSGMPGIPFNETRVGALQNDFSGAARELACGEWCQNRYTAGAFNGQACAFTSPDDCGGAELDMNQLLCEDYSCGSCSGFWSGPICDVCSLGRSFCNNRGEPNTVDCIDDDCLCDTNLWSGGKCEICPLTRDNCNDRGEPNTAFCVDDDCQCNTNSWGGDLCDVCPLTRADCNDRGEPDKTGECILTDCDCDTNSWTGGNCGVCGVDREIDCNGRGVGDSDCLYCECDVNNWSGDDCLTCPMGRVDCNDRGVHDIHCLYCDCENSWEGNFCGSCPLGRSDCNDRGVPNTDDCLADDCTCDEPSIWSGGKCQDCVLNCGLNGSPKDTCDGCDCVGDWTGDSCLDCGLGRATCNGRGDPNTALCVPNDCTCDEPSIWGGSNCQDCVLDCGVNGAPNDTCDGCDCVGDWTGDSCLVCGLERATCNGRGDPNSALCIPNDCTCDEPSIWGGGSCDFCVRDCGDNGFVPANCIGACECVNSWTGDLCDSCPLTRADCNDAGDPNTDDCIDNECTCEGHWGGGDCSTCELECVHGKPSALECDSCICEDSWEGDACDECPLVHPRNPSNCITGVCSQLWTGDMCDVCALEHPKYEDKCKAGQCEDPWIGDLCSECPIGFALFKRKDKQKSCETFDEGGDKAVDLQSVQAGLGVTSTFVGVGVVIVVILIIVIVFLLLYIYKKKGTKVVPNEKDKYEKELNDTPFVEVTVEKTSDLTDTTLPAEKKEPKIQQVVNPTTKFEEVSTEKEAKSDESSDDGVICRYKEEIVPVKFSEEGLEIGLSPRKVKVKYADIDETTTNKTQDGGVKFSFKLESEKGVDLVVEKGVNNFRSSLVTKLQEVESESTEDSDSD